MDNLSLYDEFEAEVDEAQSTLLAAVNDLTSPLGDLARAQIKRSQPAIFAAVVLAVAKPLPSTLPQSTTLQSVTVQSVTVQEENDQRRKRILLAAALEMLHIALNVHRLLVNAALTEQGGEVTLERTFIGSTILAGDYCFSRAAQMAALTDHPRVVATFALALQGVSEGFLRQQFQRGAQQSSVQSTQHTNAGEGDEQKDIDEDIDKDIEAQTGNQRFQEEPGSYDDTRQLLRSGAQAAALLVELPKNEEQQAIALSQELATQWILYKQGKAAEDQPTLNQRPEMLPGRWQALYRWLNHQRANGELRSTTTVQIK